MMRSIGGGEWKAAYATIFRKDAHQLLAWGYQDSRLRIHAGRAEEEITGFIAEAIRSRLDDQGTPDRFRHYSLHEERPAPGEHRIGRKRRRLDITVEAGYDKPRPHYVFEAKRLCKPDHPLGDYLGKEGLLRFISGETYASSQPEAGLVAYVQDHSVADWAAALRGRFAADTANRLCVTNGLRQLVLIEELPECWISDHLRKNGVEIHICHIFLDCL